MKKAITILLALMMVLSLAACGGGSAKKSKDVETDLQGKWDYSFNAKINNALCLESYEFSNGKVRYVFKNNGNTLEDKQGQYEIGDGIITITGEVSKEFEFQYDNNSLKLISGGREYEKVK